MYIQLIAEYTAKIEEMKNTIAQKDHLLLQCKSDARTASVEQKRVKKQLFHYFKLIQMMIK